MKRLVFSFALLLSLGATVPFFDGDPIPPCPRPGCPISPPTNAELPPSR
jgi:hypothetical protein